MSRMAFFPNVSQPLVLSLSLFFVAYPMFASGLDDGPARFDLAVDLRGRWTYASSEGCEEYMNITGSTHFPGGAAICQFLPMAGMETSIYQDCLEMTITGKTLQGGGPLHHMILDGEYVTDDWSAAGTRARWTSKIVAAGPNDLNAATPVVVFNAAIKSEGENSASPNDGTVAKRYIDSEGHLIQSWTATRENGTEEATFRIVLEKAEDLSCGGYDPEKCADREYDDGEGDAGWTPACCLDDYGNHQPNPNKRDCSNGTSTDVPTVSPTQSPDTNGTTASPTSGSAGLTFFLLSFQSAAAFLFLLSVTML
eukprot:CAMPEP_0197438520 /NCGR_PEP_ID=MMETSP1175-20131217/5498_1 /TAXON_ID=1003142 /ORGANISM="Triceratium dubium, Strain CCMP147" /LENGTH=309 /DNA_ID=CAMNT_0042968271 /DNA_START=46 /DNA_END=975 /DNA_ORIENTATION=-